MLVRFEVDPVGKPRMTQSDAWKKRPATTKYWKFKDDMNEQADRAGFTLPDIYSAVAHIPMPKSWSKKERLAMDGQPHQQKPDKDNIEKALNDALRPKDDSTIWLGGLIEKRWAETGSIEVFTGGEMAEHLDACISLLTTDNAN